MYTKEAINSLYRELVNAIDISDEMFEKAETEYNELGEWINEDTPAFRISIYPQGSFALGTVVRPISDEDDYDIDLVCEFAQDYGKTARQLKIDVVKPLLIKYKQIKGTDIEEKRRCWHVDYEDVPNFHMDVIPAYKYYNAIKVTNHDEKTDLYEYVTDNPSGYVKWFFDKCSRQRDRLYETYIREHHLIVAQADVEKVKRRKIKTPLQRAIQLMKRHRDIMFVNRDKHDKPVSILITTIAAQLYKEEDNVFDALQNILSNAIEYIKQSMRNGQYYIEDPSCPTENLADKWNQHPERATAFIDWIQQAEQDLADDQLLMLDKIEMATRMKSVVGEKTVQKVFGTLGKQQEDAIKRGAIRVDPSKGMFSTAGTIKVPENHHYGKN